MQASGPTAETASDMPPELLQLEMVDSRMRAGDVPAASTARFRRLTLADLNPLDVDHLRGLAAADLQPAARAAMMIVRDLADDDVGVFAGTFAGWRCGVCGGSDYDHTPDCVWARARAWFRANCRVGHFGL